MAIRVASMEFSEGTDVAVKENFVEIGDIELPDDDPVQCGSEFCVICNELAMEQQPPSLAHVYCGQTAGWIKMAFGMEVGLGPGHTVRWETSSPHKGHSSPPNFWSVSIVAKWLHGSKCHLVWR